MRTATDDAEHPITESIRYLNEFGFDDSQAKSILGAITGERPEHLVEKAPPIWIECRANLRRNDACIVMLAAQGSITLTYDDADEFQIGLARDVRPAGVQATTAGLSP